MISLFNSADDCLAHFIDQNEFEDSLLLNVLFQERVLINESNFFNSAYLADHIKQAKGEPSLFELAARQGVIIPAFRSPGTRSLEQAFQQMKGVYGESYDLLHPSMQPFRDRVVASVDAGIQRTEPFFWPGSSLASLGESYHQIIKQLLQSEDPPSHVFDNSDREQLFARVWEKSKAWRFECVEEAAERTRSKGARGLQRLELFRSIGQRLGVPASQHKVGPMDLISCCESEERLAIEVFVKWVTQCHHLNQARSFGTSINFPAYNLNQDFILDSLIRSPVDPGPSPDEGFRCTVELPPLNTLVQAGVEDLIAVRSDLGLGYLNAMRRWESDPSHMNRESVERSLRDYCEQICSRYEKGFRAPLVASFRRGASGPQVLLRDTLSAAASGSAPGLFVLMTKAVNTVFQFIRGKHHEKTTAPLLRELEITLPSQ